MIKIRLATIKDLDSIVPLFNAYRQFYKQKSDLKLAKKFISERLKNKESIIFLAFLNKQPVGFVQLYPSFSSLAAQRTLILNDLFVIDENGKILIAGQAYNENDFLSDFWIRRFTTDGIIDNSFGLNGEVIVDFGNQAMNIQSDDQLTTIELQGSKVLLVGQSENDEQANR